MITLEHIWNATIRGHGPTWLAALLIVVPAQAQSASLWETSVILAGRPTGPATRSCVAGDVYSVLVVRWPDSCRIEPTTGTGTGQISQAVCRVDTAGNRVAFRREVQGSPGVGLKIVMTTHTMEANGASRAGQDITTIARYLGPCSSAPAQAQSVEPSRYGSAISIAGSVAIAIVQIILFVGGIYGSLKVAGRLIMRLARGRYAAAIVENIVIGADGAATIPVLATFTGVRGLPWWYGVATNNAKPLLMIAKDGIHFRVIRLQRRPYADIECVDIRIATGTVNLDITFRGALLTFAANLGAVPLAEHVLAMLPEGTPLSGRATALLMTHESSN